MSGSWIFHDLPLPVLKEQRQWDRRHRARIARVHNLATYTAIAESMGLSVERIRCMVRQADQEIARKRRCPAEKYINAAGIFGLMKLK